MTAPSTKVARTETNFGGGMTLGGGAGGVNENGTGIEKGNLVPLGVIDSNDIFAPMAS